MKTIVAQKIFLFAFLASGLSYTPRSVAPPAPVSRASVPLRKTATALRQPCSSPDSSSEGACSAGRSDGECRLRILLINDVYELKNWPRFQTAVRELSLANTVVILAGDFVGPALLSSYDNARGMIDCMNKCGIHYACFGNHETDIPHAELVERIKESNFQWINSNIEGMDLGGISLPTYVNVDVEGGGHRRRVGLMGLVTEDPVLYQPGAFNGATISPVGDTAEQLSKYLHEHENLDLIIPITHQSIARDRAFASRFCEPGSVHGNAFPLVLGGHDHAAYAENVGDAHIVKTSCDIHEIAVCDVVWPNSSGQHVEITSRFHPILSFQPDLEMQRVVDGHLRVLAELDAAPLLAWRSSLALTSQHNRMQETLLCSRLASETRDALGSECCVINAGNIRGGKDYGTGAPFFFNYNDLRAEIPFDCETVVVDLPGAVLQAAMVFSRQSAVKDPPLAAAAFLHTDDRTRFDMSTFELEVVDGRPFDASKVYRTAILLKLLTGVDKIEPLVEWARGHAAELLRVVGSPESEPRRLKGVLVEHWSRAIWAELGKALPPGVPAGRDAVAAAALRTFGTAVPEVWLNNAIRAADADGDGAVSPREALRAALHGRETWEAMRPDGEGQLRQAELAACALRVFPGDSQAAAEAAEGVWRELQPRDAAPSVGREEVRQWMALQLRQGKRAWAPGETKERDELRASLLELREMAGMPKAILRAHSFRPALDEAAGTSP